MKACEEILDSELFDKCILHFEQVFKELPPPDGPCLVHLDFRPGNILVNDDSVTGIIDFESSRGGSSEIDFTKVYRDIWKKQPLTRTAYVSGYQSIRPIIDLDKILPFYSFFDAFSSVAWCKKRGIEKNKAFLADSITILRA